MKKLILLFLFIPVLLFGQMMNHSWGYSTSGTAYNQTGYSDADSSTTISIVYDLQDWYPLDINPLFSDDSVIIGSSHKMLIGTFWYKLDAQNATDSTVYAIKVYPGFMDYYGGTGDRIATANIDYGTTATTLIDTSSTLAVNDVTWKFLNVYLNSSADAGSNTVKHYPSEFYKIAFTFGNGTADSLDVYWDFVYPAVYQSQQELRTTTNSGNAIKDAETLH